MKLIRLLPRLLPFVIGSASLALVLLTARFAALEIGRDARVDWHLERASAWFDFAARLGSEEARERRLDCLVLQGRLRELHEALKRGGARSGLKGARHWRRLGVVLAGSDRADEALAALAEARQLLPDQGDDSRRLEARVDIDEARVLYYSKGQLDRAHELLERSVATARRLGDRELEAHGLRNLGVVLWLRDGEEDPAERFYQPALELYRELGHRWGEAVTLSNLGLIVLEHGDVRAFLRHQRRSLEIKKQIGDLLGESESYTYLASLYRDFGNYGRAFELAEAGLDIAERIGYRQGAQLLEFRLAEYAVLTGRHEEGERRLEAIAAATTDPWLAGQRWWRLADLLVESGRFEAARRSLDRALELSRRAHADSTEGVWWKHLVHARLALAEGKRLEAEENLEKARRLLPGRRPLFVEKYLLTAEIAFAEAASSSHVLELLVRLVEVESRELDPVSGALFLGDPLAHSSSREKLWQALLEGGLEPDAAARVAHRALETQRHGTLRDLRLATRGRPSGPSQHRAQEPPLPLELSKIDLGSAAAGQALSRDYARWQDWLLSSRLRSTIGAIVRRHNPQPLDVTRQKLPARGALVEYLIAGDRVAALVSTRRQARLVELPVSRTVLEIQTDLLRSLLSRQDAEGWRPVAASLGHALVGVLESRGLFDGLDELYVIPYGPLHRLPFSALLLTDGERLLIDRFAITHLPAAALVRSTVAPRSSVSRAISFGFGDFEANPLAHAEREALQVAERLGGAAFVGAGASEEAFRRELPEARIVHLAAHGVNVETWPLLSGLRLAATESHDGWLTLPEVLDLSVRADLVVLAACRSGEHNMAATRGSEAGRLALGGAFLYAGARQVLASLLPIEDRSTARLMEIFYEQLESETPARALAGAQRAMAADPEVHPGTWASFALFGTGES